MNWCPLCWKSLDDCRCQIDAAEAPAPPPPPPPATLEDKAAAFAAGWRGGAVDEDPRWSWWADLVRLDQAARALARRIDPSVPDHASAEKCLVVIREGERALLAEKFR